METITFDTWEPVVAPYVGRANAYMVCGVIVLLMAFGLVSSAVEVLSSHVTGGRKAQNKVWYALIALGMAGIALGVIWVSTLQYANYIVKYGKLEEMYLEEVVPALERIQQSTDVDLQRIDDTKTVLNYTAQLAYAVERGDKPAPIYQSFADFILQTNTEECLGDLCDYDRLVNALDFEKIAEAF